MGLWDDLSQYTPAIAGTALTTIGNTIAAKSAGDAAREGAAIKANAIAAAAQQAKDTYGRLENEAAPGRSYLRTVVADPGTLTPLQQQQLADSRLATSNMIHSSDFAGSGRSGVDLLRRNESDFVNQALENNRQRAMTAGQTLAGEAFQAGNKIGDTDLASTAKIGDVQGDAVAKAGLYNAQAGLANAGVAGKAIGDVGSMIAKDQRQSRYADRVGSIEKSLGLTS